MGSFPLRARASWATPTTSHNAVRLSGARRLPSGTRRVADNESLCWEYEVRRDRRCQRMPQPKPQYRPQHSWVSAFEFEVAQQAIEATSCEAWLAYCSHY
ncbi:hypothetical protein V496_02831 [Pseudogymnoascus sp. VKM F-4515 (FW-2607)]|nr:hypothetical protein V496_02831 [Pseudogymnoascus sp. VKM F-4515 (FW-2607)]